MTVATDGGGTALPDDARVDVMRDSSGEAKAVPAGEGAAVVEAERYAAVKRVRFRRLLVGAVVLVLLGYSAVVLRNVVVGLVAAALVANLSWWLSGDDADPAVLDRGITLGDARERWDATPAGGLEPPGERREGRERREHAYE